MQTSWLRRNLLTRGSLIPALCFATASQAAFIPTAGWTEIAHSDGSVEFNSGVYANGLNTGSPANANWAMDAGDFDHLGDAFTVALAMGEVTDYYRVRTVGGTLEQMLTSNTNHLWSDSADGTFVQPGYYSTHLGGSSVGWPGDGRLYLGFWGSSSQDGACCTTSYSGSASWQQPFTLYVRDNNFTASVPSPGAWALLLAGWGLLRLKARR